ncbi:VirB3 family type IV secretion system protein [Neorhizobium sp. NCHU2750]|uniref:type IV secretion system protein VirB3 n=1 Tax=Neorhizobium sp. NCHU2750 TaxID=1825976 RepID=UPI000E75AE54|nr:type IV secretion protein AvhB3 [Neorhizobium sp. NCHU2750]
MEPLIEDKPILTPVVIGLTRPPMLWGVPYIAMVIVIALTIIAWLATNRFAALGLAPVVYVILFSLCASDVKCLDVMQVACQRTPRTPNRTFWGATSYGP